MQNNNTTHQSASIINLPAQGGGGHEAPETLHAAVTTTASRLIAASKSGWSLPSSRLHAKMFESRYGICGEGASTLQAVGNEHGVSRERVRQVVAKMLECKDKAHLVDVATLATALENHISKTAPQTAGEMEKSCAHLLGGLPIESAIRFCGDLFGRQIALIKPSARRGGEADKVIFSQRDLAFEEEIVRSVRNSISRSLRTLGAAQLHYVIGDAVLDARNLDAQRVVSLIESLDGFQWINRDDGWFWFGPGRPGRVWNTVRKVLCAADGPVDVLEICTALQRSKRDPGDRLRPVALDLPMEILCSMLHKTPWVKGVWHNDFSLVEPLDIEATLSRTENAILHVIRSCGGVAARATISHEICYKQGLGFVGVQVCLDNSPIFVRLSRGIYAVRGAEVSDQTAFARAMVERSAGGEEEDEATMSLNSR